MQGEVSTVTSDHKKVKVKIEWAASWLIDYYLRHENGCVSGNAKVQIWNIAKHPFEEYSKYCVPKNREDNFSEFLNSRNIISRNFFKKKVRKKWNKIVAKSYLLIELNIQTNEEMSGSKINNLKSNSK